MSDRLKELTGQALDKIVPYTWTTLTREEFEKLQTYFAELVVRDCVEIIESWAEDDFAINGIAIEILERFDMEL